jgi:membrane-associated protein
MSALLIIKTLGLVGIFLTVFVESGLFFGFFLPGDSLLFIAGLLAAAGSFDIKTLIVVCLVAAIAGDSFGYWIGSRYGRRFFNKEESFFFKKSYLLQTEIFYERHGAYAVVIARFIPIVRVFAATVAGISLMNYRKFFLYNVLGGLLWVLSLTLMGYYLGRLIPNPDVYILPIIFAIIVISFLPIVWKVITLKWKKQKVEF